MAYFLVFLLYTSVGHVKQSTSLKWKPCNSQAKSQKVPFHRFLPSPVAVRLCTTVDRDYDTLVVSGVVARELRVYEGGVIRYQRRAQPGLVNLPLTPHVVRLSLKSGKRRSLTLALRGQRELGLQAVPIATSWSKAKGTLPLSQFLFHQVPWVLVGCILLMGGILLLFATFSSQYRAVYLMTGIASLLSVLYLTGFSYFEGLSTSPLFWRKCHLAVGMLATLSLLGGMERLVFQKSRLSLWMSLLTLVAIVLLFVFGNLSSLPRLTALSDTMLVLNTLLILGVTLAGERRSLVFTCGFCCVSFLHTRMALSQQMDMAFLSTLGIVVCILGLGMFLMQRFIELHYELAVSKRLANSDSLTDAYNRHYLNDLRCHKDDVLVLVDMNNFKYINDTFGHHIGDEMLVQWVKSAKSLLSTEDRVVRLGGDEFLLILAAPVNADLGALLQKIEDDWRTHFEGMPVSFSYGSEPVGDSLHDSLERADIHMYAHKKNVKNQRYEVITQESVFLSPGATTLAYKSFIVGTPLSHSAVWTSSHEQTFFVDDPPPSEED